MRTVSTEQITAKSYNKRFADSSKQERKKVTYELTSGMRLQALLEKELQCKYSHQVLMHSTSPRIPF